jgi:hypothetical protein
MKRAMAMLGAIILLAACPLYADYRVEKRGSWPGSWPSELEKLRKQSRTLVGPLRPLRHYAIPFTKRETFESAWPHLLKVKSQGAPLVLRWGPSFSTPSIRSNASVVIGWPRMILAPFTRFGMLNVGSLANSPCLCTHCIAAFNLRR